jgi:hypothetical protein
MSYVDQTLTWVDGKGNSASVSLNSPKINMFFQSGTNLVGTLDAACAMIDWGGGHQDYKITGNP